MECVDSIHAIKYLFKYIVKGNDSATFTIESKNTSENKSTDIDEIKLFQNKRYTSAGEGAWRIFCNEICEQFPPSNRLQIHLPGQQTVYFDASNKDQSIESIKRSETTKLTAFFDLCTTDEHAQKLLYERVPEFYTWNTNDKKWYRRKQQSTDEEIVDSIRRIFN